MKKITYYILSICTFFGTVQCQNKTTSIPEFEVPESMQAMNQWHKQEEFWYL